MTVAFDLDGTLITAEAKQSALLRATARRFGLDVAPEEAWARKREGMSTRAALADMGVDPALADAISAEWIRFVETPYWQSLDRPFDDALPVLAALAGAGEACILVSARSNPYLLRQQVARLGLSPHLAEVFCVDPFNAAVEKAAVTTGQRSGSFLAGCGVQTLHATLAEIFEPPVGTFDAQAR